MERPTAAAVRVAIALGSNLGDRARHLADGVERLRAVLTDVQASSTVESAPEGGVDQPPYLNAALVGRTTLSPRDLLDRLLAIEREQGRRRTGPGSSRTLDLDLVLYEGRRIAEPGLEVPHPRFRQRWFVLAPLAEIAPDLVDPVTGETIDALLKRLGRRTGPDA